jgi:phospholipase A1/A2
MQQQNIHNNSLPAPQACIWLLCLLAHHGSIHAQNQGMSAQDTCLLQAIKAADAQQAVSSIIAQCSARQEPNAAAQQNTLPKPPESTLRLPGSDSLERSPFNDRLQSELRTVNEPFALLPHRPNYLLPLSYHQRDAASVVPSGGNKSTEAQFQLSFKIPLTKPLWNNQLMPFFAYTGRAWWQVYDSERSRPFREYNHEPEFFVALPVSGMHALGWKLRAASIGFNHQSNGRSVPESRSWNRIVGELYADHSSNTWSSLKVWNRLPESAKILPTDSKGDDNPDINRYMGNFESHYGYIPRPLGRYLSSVLESTVSAGHCKTKTSREACAA